VNEVTLEELLLWNPGLGANINSTTCSFTQGVRYCGWFYRSPSSSSDRPRRLICPEINSPHFRRKSSPPLTIFLGGLRRQLYPTSGRSQGFTCNDVLDVYGLAIAQFYKMNPAVKANCYKLRVGQACCVASPNVPASDPTTSGVSVAPSSTSKAPRKHLPTPGSLPVSAKATSHSGWSILRTLICRLCRMAHGWC
jgi:hypothetical protein